MNTREALQAVHEAGTPVAFIAKRINKDPSTLSKWLRGTSNYMSKETEEALRNEIHSIKELWAQINI